MFAILAVGMLAERRGEKDMVEVHARQRAAFLIVGVALAAACLMTITVFASPKLGPRFFMHGMFLLLGGVLGIVSAVLHRPRSFAPFVAIEEFHQPAEIMAGRHEASPGSDDNPNYGPSSGIAWSGYSAPLR